MNKIIYTITPNPALDLSGTVNEIIPNEKCYVHDEIRAPGGNAINVARILNRMGLTVKASGFLGGSTGLEIESLLYAENVKTDFIKIQGSTRINVTVSNVKDHQQTRLSFAGPCIQKKEKERLFNFFSKQKNISTLVLGGSLPQGFTPSDIVKLMKMAQNKNIKTVIDCPGGILSQVVSAQPCLIKPNLEEFHELTRSRVKTIGAVVNKAQKLLNDVQYICVSSVEGGTVLVTRDGSYFGRIPKIKIRSTVGAGDSMVAAMVAQLQYKKNSDENILRWGLAAAAATLSHMGTSLGQASEIKKLYLKTFVEVL